MDLYISESMKGIHSVGCKLIGARMMAFTFRPSFQSINAPVEDLYYEVDIPISKNPNFFKVEGIANPYDVLLDKYGKNVVKMISGLFVEWGSKNIYLAHDLDVSGQLMASLLYHHLVKEGIPADRIIRFPLMDIDYDGRDDVVDFIFGFGDFYSEAQLHAIIELIRFEQVAMNGWNKIGVGYRKMFSMMHIEAKRRLKEYKIVRKNKNTNIATYFTNYLIAARETYRANKAKKRYLKEQKGKGGMP